MNKIIKNWYLFIPTILLLIAVGDLDYGYYEILRIIVTIFATVFVYMFKAFENISLMIIMIIVAILFNPILPIHLDKDTWVFLDFISSILFLISAISVMKNQLVNNNKQ